MHSMKKGVVGLFIAALPCMAFSQGIITFNNRVNLGEPNLPPGGITFVGEPVVSISTFQPGTVVFFPGTGGSGSSYSTGSGSGLGTPPSTPSDVRSRSFSGSDYF